MKYLSVCSGIEAASKAWEPIGWEPVAFSEIEPFPAAVLKHHWPKVQNLGDMTKYEQWNIQSGTVDLLVGGTPCQSFSVAGLRQGLKDPRGNLMLTYLAIAERFKPRWLVWENVPGVLSSNGGKDFGSFLGALGELGYVDWAYRILDAQWFGVAQRRRRVFVVAHLGEGNLAAKVLFESESVRRDTPPSRKAGQGVAINVETGVGVSLPEREVVGCLSDGAHMGGGLNGQDAYSGRIMAVRTEPVIIDRAAFNQGQNAQYKPRIEHGETMDSLVARGPHAVLFENHPNDSRVTGPHDVAPSCVSRYGTGGGNVPLVQESMAFQQNTRDEVRYINGDGAIAGALAAETGAKQQNYIHIQQSNEAIAFEPGIATREGSESRFVKELSPTLRKEMGDNQVAVNDSRMAVRRLTPKECERLQGFNDDHTMIPWRNKPADQCPDGPRYKALGNSMAVPCMAWIGKRIDAVEGNMK